MGLSKTIVKGVIGLSVVAGMAALTPAYAITVVGKWDPAFGSAFPDLGWRGQATFFVPDACLSQSGWVLNSDSCSSFGMKIVSAEVEFYKFSDPTNATYQETLLFGTPSSAVVSVELDNGMLEGVLGTFLYSRSSTLPLAGGTHTEFVLFFEGDLARMFYVSDPPGGPKTSGFSEENPIGGRPFMTFSIVPEPTSLSLLGVGLLFTAWLSRGRREGLGRPASRTSRGC
jgi:hypothetical protein